VKPPTKRLYGERVIHGEIYKARPDVHAVVHHHAPAIMPFCVAGVELTPVFHLGAAMGPKVPFWDSRDDFGDTNLLVVKPEEGASLARALGEYWTVLMRRHGATVAGRNLREVVFRTIYGARSAEYQSAAHALGHVGALSPGEIEMAASFNLGPMPVERAWEYWAVRLAKREGRAVQTGRPAPARAVGATRKTTAKKAASKTKAKAKRGRK
jgi:HCOMODA/2-hydroxy-3-carboxy-muconic semialdehyde decarboxylase